MARRRVLALLASALPAACGTEDEPQVAQQPPTVPPLSSGTPAPAPAPSRAAPKAPAEKAEKAGNPAGKRGGPVPFKAGEAMAGSYLALGGMSLEQSLALRRKQLGRGQRIVHRFYPWDGHVPTSEPDVGKDSVLMVSWHGTAYDRINNGSSDRVIASVASKLAGMKRPILLRWGWEMNGNWFEWDGSHNGDNPAAYVSAWRRLHRIFRDKGADNVAWVWSPNWNSAPDTSWNTFQRYYPGDSYVDWVGVSGYDFYDESPTTLFTAITRAYGDKKPIILSETAAVDLGSGSKAKWIKKLSAWVRETPAVGAVVWFDTDIQDGSPHNFRPDTDPAALAAYKAMVNSSRFGG